MGRRARGDEIACGAGGCRNLAEWKVLSDLLVGPQDRKTWVFCGLHRDSGIKLLRQRKFVDIPGIEPFQEVGPVRLHPSQLRARLPWARSNIVRRRIARLEAALVPLLAEREELIGLMKDHKVRQREIGTYWGVSLQRITQILKRRRNEVG